MMNTILKSLTALVAIFIFNFCTEEPSAPPFVEKYCPPPYDTLSGKENPIVIDHGYQKVSPDGEKLAYLLSEFELRVLNLKTGKVQNIDFREKLPPHIKYIAVSKALWCPYNSNRLLAHIVTMTDTVGDGKRFTYGQNLYILSLDGKEFTRVTPKGYGLAGTSGGLYINTWLKESNKKEDKIILGAKTLYIPQKDTLYQIFTETKKRILNMDRDNINYYFNEPNPSGKFNYYINDIEIPFKEKQLLSVIAYSSFSPDGRKLALSVQISAVEDGRNIPYYLQRFSEVWIIDVEKFLREKPDTAIYPDRIINYRKAFCMYNYEAGYAEYITNDRLAVSMFHTVNDGYGFLYEITEDGRMVRQLTFVP